MQLCDLHELIPKRKSVRAFSGDPDEGAVERLVDFLSAQEAPNEKTDWDFDILSEDEMFALSAGNLKIRAPRYLVLRSERKSFYAQNIGYIGSLAELWLSANGMGACWQAGISVNPDDDFEGSLSYISSIAFGKTDNPHRTRDEIIDRQPLNKLCKGAFEGEKLAIAQAVRLAPSAMNSQPISLRCNSDGDIEVFRKTSFTDHSADVELSIAAGIALAYIRVAGESLGLKSHFYGKKPRPIWGVRVYTASVSFEPIEKS